MRHFTSFLKVGVLVLGGALLGAAAAPAAVVTVAGDLILGFRSDNPSHTYDLEVNLGNFNTLLGLGVGTHNLNAGGVLGANYGLRAQDLIDTFGTDWNTEGISWSVGGADGTAGNNRLFVTSTTDFLLRKAAGTQNPVRGTLDTLRAGLNGQNNTFGTLNSARVDGTYSSGYSDLISGGSGQFTLSYNYNFGTDNIEAGVSSTGYVTANFFRLQSGAQAQVERLGYFTLGSDGSFTYTVVPEPSAALLAGDAALTVMVRRRRAFAESKA